MNEKIEKIIDKLLTGDLNESRQAKKDLQKELEHISRSVWDKKKGEENNKKAFKELMSQIYEILLSKYPDIKRQNKYSTISFLGHALFYLSESREYYKKLLLILIEAMKDREDGTMRNMAVLCGDVVGTIASFRDEIQGVSKKDKANKFTYKQILLDQLDQIFDYLETIIETDKDKFPIAIDTMKPSVTKSFLLYISKIDRFDVIESHNEIYDGENFFPDNEYSKEWRKYFTKQLDTHPNIKKFAKHVMRFDNRRFEDEEESGGYSEMVDMILDKEEKGFVPSDKFLSEMEGMESPPGGWAIPSDSYFEIMDIVRDCDEQKDLKYILDKIYIKAHFAKLSEIYWFDLVAFILSKIKNFPDHMRILDEAIKKLLPKVDIDKPISTDSEKGINAICYGIHEHRPIFRILIAYAIYHDDFGDKETAKAYYKFLLKLNPNDNQGVRYLLASLYAGKPASYTNVLFDEGNKKQNWDELENFLSEQNKIHHFWEEHK